MKRTIKKRVAFYHVVSQQEKAGLGNAYESSGLEKKVARTCGLKIYRNYIDDTSTGTLAKQKPDFLKMIKDAEDGKFDVILTDAIYTFSSDGCEALYYCRLLKEKNVEVKFSGLGGFSTFETIDEPLMKKMEDFMRAHEVLKRQL